MKPEHLPPQAETASTTGPGADAAPRHDDDLLSPLLQGHAAPLRGPLAGALVGRLLALTERGLTPLVAFDGQLSAGAVAARSTVELGPAHVGREVLLVFEGGDPQRPIVTGVLRGQPEWPGPQVPGRVALDADGQRLTVTASQELVLRCGRAVLRLHADGRIELRGESIVAQADGVHRIRGGSVQLN
ncbi:MAG: hypothetical protein HY855_05695 [Burkholderiales bacterium]|nr:hypothetical protein [Burkholderiales bacterium]